MWHNLIQIGLIGSFRVAMILTFVAFCARFRVYIVFPVLLWRPVPCVICFTSHCLFFSVDYLPCSDSVHLCLVPPVCLSPVTPFVFVGLFLLSPCHVKSKSGFFMLCAALSLSPRSLGFGAGVVGLIMSATWKKFKRHDMDGYNPFSFPEAWVVDVIQGWMVYSNYLCTEDVPSSPRGRSAFCRKNDSFLEQCSNVRVA